MATLPRFSLRGRWYLEQGQPYPWTAWANENLTIMMGNVTKATKFSFKVVAKNHLGPLPPNYPYFNLNVYQGYFNAGNGSGVFRQQLLGSMRISASANWRVGNFTAVVAPHPRRAITFVWTNDKYKQGVYDSNIMFRSVEVTP